jgi:dUTP pyrophosphatase
MIKIYKRRSDKAKRLGLDLRKAHKDDAGWDVPVCWDSDIGDAISLRPGEKRDIPSGISIHIPEGYWAEIKARGSSFAIRDLHIHDAVWDAGFNDEIKVAVKNMSDKPIRIKDGERIAQIIFHEVVEVEWEDIENDLPESERHLNQMGSSGL